MSSALIFTLLLSGLGIGGNIFADAEEVPCFDGPCGFPRCPYRWTLHEGRCYLFRGSESTWGDAETFCNLFKAHLTSIQRPDQYSFLREFIKNASGTNTRTWVGGTNAVQNDLWMWTDGSPFTFTAWGSGEPNNVDGKEHCMEINLRVFKLRNNVLLRHYPHQEGYGFGISGFFTRLSVCNHG
ncbi:galactose-specific lectin nattectin [Austrofundulus limnaeus]|uniref:Galactose-specific lectin nattectin n=1 Tax=Austrofundulus limnaeus TaxID=52670 RepID=A0A2I4BTB1_AUSLI|nr:PREDICTED: galactose-specific lectin nattectin-like [Austrofundulus limnaeus]